ncbi:hypothetical protein Aduo_002203 [Ancylostoma duodenale]
MDISGVKIERITQPGHVQFTCKDNCLAKVKFEELKGVHFPGAFAKGPVVSVWNAWKAASSFIRTDIDIAEKIKYYTDHIVSLDARAVVSVLTLAYNRCRDWTTFICSNAVIKRHVPVDGNDVQPFMEAALKAVRTEMLEEEKQRRPVKIGGTGFAAPEYGRLLETDGPRGSWETQIVTTFIHVRDALDRWKHYKNWVIVWPAEPGVHREVVKEVVKRCKTQFEEGGTIVSAWMPLLSSNAVAWMASIGLWETIEATLARLAKSGQFYTTASSRIENGRVFTEAGAPEGSVSYYTRKPVVQCAKMLYDAIKLRAPRAGLPERPLLDTLPPRTTAPGGGGVWERDRSPREGRYGSGASAKRPYYGSRDERERI